MKYAQILLGIILCIAFEFVLYKINHRYRIFTPVFSTVSISEKRGNPGKYTNPLLECVNTEDEGIQQLHISKSDLIDYVTKTSAKYKLDDLSVYVRDLNNGPWIGVNEDEEFIGGSLLKVPILISYLKLAESDPNILKKEIVFQEKTVPNDQYYTSDKQIEVGQKYTVENLLEYMIYYSDNNAAYLLFQNLPTEEFYNTFEALGFGRPDPNEPFPTNTVTYSGFFRILYNVAYLDKSSSEKALDMLAHVEFNQGLGSRLPKNLTISHKFGIRSDKDVNQLHDCGIVYYPGHPYLLCIMTKSKGSFDDMSKSIGDISRFVYDQISK